MNASVLRTTRLPLTLTVTALVVVALLLLPHAASGYDITVGIDAGGVDNEFTEGDEVPFTVTLTLEIDEILGATVTADLEGPDSFSRSFVGIPIGDDGTTFGPSTATSDVLVLATPTADTTISGTVTHQSIEVKDTAFGYAAGKFGYKGIVQNASIGIDGILVLPGGVVHGEYTLTFTVDNGLGESFKQSKSVTLTVLDSLETTLPEGWSTFSIPIAAANGKFFADADLGSGIQNGLVDEDNVEVAYKFNADTQLFEQVVSNTTITPTEAVLVKSKSEHDATLIFKTTQSGPPSRVLSADWNLMGLAVPLDQTTMAVDEALISVFVASSDEVGYTIVVSPSINPDPFIFTRGGDTAGKDLERSLGYWVFMEKEDTLAGFSTTPVEP